MKKTMGNAPFQTEKNPIEWKRRDRMEWFNKTENSNHFQSFPFTLNTNNLVCEWAKIMTVMIMLMVKGWKAVGQINIATLSRSRDTSQKRFWCIVFNWSSASWRLERTYFLFFFFFFGSFKRKLNSIRRRNIHSGRIDSNRIDLNRCSYVNLNALCWFRIELKWTCFWNYLKFNSSSICWA